MRYIRYGVTALGHVVMPLDQATAPVSPSGNSRMIGRGHAWCGEHEPSAETRTLRCVWGTTHTAPRAEAYATIARPSVSSLITRGTIEDRIAELQTRKAALAEAILGGDGRGQALSREDLDFLLSPI